ncbi:MAG: hypothetical protein AAGC74_14455, partial [Verrucomicrobiota bacterium]
KVSNLLKGEFEMSDMMISGRGPGLIGGLLGFFVLAAFAGLAFLVLDGRANGSDATRLREFVQGQRAEVLDLKEDIATAKRRIEKQSRNELVARELAGVEQRIGVFEERAAEIQEEIEEGRRAIADFGVSKIEHLKEYRISERTQAIGETFERVELVNGTVLKNVELREIFTDGVRFKTATGSRRVSWEDLPHDDWKDRFQIGAEEVAAMRKARATSLGEQAKITEAASENRQHDLEVMDMRKKIRELERKVNTYRKNIETSLAKVKTLRRQSSDARRRLNEARSRGSVSIDSGKANKLATAADKIEAQVNLARTQLREMQRDLQILESDLRRKEREGAR